jgi:hypothetical protein
LLASLDWEELFPYCFLEALSSDISNHCPILMHSNAVLIKSKPKFHFESYWLKFDDYLDAVQRGWQCPVHVLDLFRRLDCLLRNVAKELQSWVDRKIGNIKEQLLLTKEVVLQLERAQDRRELSPEEAAMRQQLMGLCLGLSSLEHTIARQRSRITYLKEGDANTRFFHLHGSYRKRKNFIRSLEADGVHVTEHEAIAAILHPYYEQLLREQSTRTATLNFEALGIMQKDLTALDLPFTEEEVWNTIKELPSDKSPGLDGMTDAFYKSS